MSYYKNIFNNKIEIAGSSKGAKPAFLMPPDGTFSKVAFSVYEALDLICEGPVAGLVNKEGLLLQGNRAIKEYNNQGNKIGSNSIGIDQGIYYNDVPLRGPGGSPTAAKYDLGFMTGEEFQDGPQIIKTPRRIVKINQIIKGPYIIGSGNGARNGTGSQDIRTESGGNSAHAGPNLSFLNQDFNKTVEDVDFDPNSPFTPDIIALLAAFIGVPTGGARDFVNWQNFVPSEQLEKPFYHNNYDKNIKKLDISLVVNKLNDTRSASTKSENESGKSKMGQLTAITITFEIAVGKVDKFGNETISAASFVSRGGKGVSVGSGNGRVAVSGVVSAPYHISLENISLPEIEEDDLYSFVRVRKIESETYSSLVNREGGVANIIEIIDENLLYPNSVCVESSIDAKYFPSVPSRTFRLKGKKVLIPSNYTPINEDGSDRRFCTVQDVLAGSGTKGNLIYSGDWDGTFKFGWTDNPAWIFYDLLVNTRYGVGAYLRDVNIVDKWSLYDIGMYCDAVTMNDGSRTTNASGAGVFIGLDDGFGGLEPRFSSNVLITDQTTAFEALQDFAKSFMAMTYYNNSTINVKVDRPYFFEDFNRNDAFEDGFTFSTASDTDDYINPPKEKKFPPHLIFNNLNVKDGLFVYSDVDKNTKFNAVEVSYLDKRNNFTYKTEYAEDPESIKKIGLNFKQIDGLGVTSRGQAHRLARSLLFEASNTSEKVSFTAGFDAMLLEPGDIIKIDDEIKNFTKNFGIVIGTSGEETYYDPDGTGSPSLLNSGIGPKAIIVEPAKQSDQLNYLTGGILTIVNPIGKSGINDFYLNPNSDNDLYRQIHNPQVIELELKPGGSGLTYDVKEDGTYLYIDHLKFFAGTNLLPSQWFSEKDANIVYGSEYSVDASGRSPKYYRVISINESQEEGFDVTATIFHTGKHKFIEEGIRFDTDEDTFEPELTLSQISRPNPPQSITTGAFSSQADKSLVLPIEITAAATNAGDRFIVFLEEPNTNSIEGQVNKSATLITDFDLSGEQKIDQVGEYTITVLSENSSNGSRSTGFASLNFTTTPDDFSFDINNDAFIEYYDINLSTDFSENYSTADRTGSGINSFKENDPEINAVFNVKFKDAFGNNGNSVLQNVSGQRIDLRNVQGELLVSGLKTLTNETTFQINNDEINSGFGYTGDGRYVVPPSVDFEIAAFTLTGTGTTASNHFVSFEENFDETPVVFTSLVTTGVEAKHRKIGIQSVASGGFTITGKNELDNNFNYIATKTGTFPINSFEKIEVGTTSKNNTSGYREVLFNNTFTTTPNVIIQIQKPETSKESFFCETVITGITTTGFFFNAFQPDGSTPSGTGVFGYIATENNIFNVLSSSEIAIDSLNYASTGESSLNFVSTEIFESINGSNNTGLRFNHDNAGIFIQRLGTNSGLRDKCMSILRTTGNKNQIALHYFDKTNDTSGMYFGSEDESLNFIDVISGAAAAATYDFTGDLSLETWARFDEGLTGKQYLFEHYLSGTGIGWFQSGDGKNYINVNGTDFEASATNLNDGEKHNVRVVLDRDAGIKTYIDGSLDITNTGITGSDFTGDLFASTGFKVLANDQQTGSTMHQGGVYHYFGFIASGITGDYTNSPDSFRDTYSGHADSVFLINTGESSIVDYTANNNQVTISGDLIVLDQLIDQSSFTTDVSIIQISSTGQL